MGEWGCPFNDTKNILKSIKNVADGVEAYHKIVSQVDDKHHQKLYFCM